jgi:hypothetical protein
MSKAFVIEARSNEAGIVVQNGRHYRFFAANPEFFALEGRDFHSPSAAQRAVEDCIAVRGGKRTVS